MRIGVILASSQRKKVPALFEDTQRCARGHEVFCFGCAENEEGTYSYIDISVLTGLLLNSRAVDFVVTGCSSGQGMMLACNSMPGVLCGYAPTPRDAYLFGQINDGNAISLPLGEEYTFGGFENLSRTLEALFSEPFGQGWPKDQAARKLKDTALLKSIRKASQVSFLSLLDRLDRDLIRKALRKKDVIRFILEHGGDAEISGWIRRREQDL